MKKLLSLLCFLPLFSEAQIIQTQPTALNFGNVTVGQKDSLSLTLTNTGSQSVNITNIKNYLIYGDYPFTVSQTTLSLTAGASQSIWVYFEPEHNILNNSELVIQHNTTSGNTAVDVRGQGVFGNTYYSSTQNLEEEALKTALKTRLGQGYNQRSYNQARDAMYATIDNNSGQVECAYTGRRATFNTRSGANSNSFNCEHTFPQGFFNQNLPMRSDIHHLFSTDVTANSRRSNFPFGIVSGSGTWSQGGSKVGGGVFEPRNVQKGRTARAMMYFVIRYQDYSGHFGPQETTLRNWHNTYPPNASERQRNNDIFNVQNNRNPFVDYPQLEERITNFVSFSTKPTQLGLDITQTSIDFGNFSANQADTFVYVLVNRGNQTINFSNFSLSNNQYLSFGATSGSNQSLNPGDAIKIEVIAQTQGIAISLNESLSFNTSLPGSQSSFTIPIRGNSIITGLQNSRLESQLSVYPNPVEDRLLLEHPAVSKLQLKLYNSSAQEIATSWKQMGTSALELETSHLKQGVYFLEINNGSKSIVKKILK